MKRVIFVMIFLLAGISKISANSDLKMRFALNGMFYNSASDRFIPEYNTYSAEVGVVFRDKLLLGLGSGYSQVFRMGEPFGRTFKYLPLYADVKYYQSLCKWVKVYGGVEVGCEFRKLTKKQAEFNRPKDHQLLYYPQIGTFIRIYKRLGVEIAYGYRSALKDFWIPNFSIVLL